MPAPVIGRRPRWLPGPHARVDWSHPLSQGLLGFVAPAYVADLSDQLTVAQTWATSNPTWTVSGMGPARMGWLQTDRIDVGQTGVPIVGNRSAFTITTVIEAAADAYEANGSALYCERGTAGNPICKISYGDPPSNSGRFLITYRNNAGTLINSGGVATVNGTGPAVGALRRNSNTSFEMWVNGRKDQTFTSGSMNSTFSEATLSNRLGSDAADTNADFREGVIVAVLLHGRALPDEAMAALTSDPFQVLRF